jgi:hypothetical protein
MYQKSEHLIVANKSGANNETTDMAKHPVPGGMIPRSTPQSVERDGKFWQRLRIDFSQPIAQYMNIFEAWLDLSSCLY